MTTRPNSGALGSRRRHRGAYTASGRRRTAEPYRVHAQWKVAGLAKAFQAYILYPGRSEYSKIRLQSTSRAPCQSYCSQMWEHATGQPVNG
jgi:hypothetical protein